MKKTIRIKLNLNQETKKCFLSLMKITDLAYNDYVTWAINNKSYSKIKAHNDLYSSLRVKYSQIPSALLQSTRDVALESIKQSKFKTKLRNNSKYSSIRYDARTFTLRGNQATLSTHNNRVKTILDIPKVFKTIIDSWKIKGGTTLCYDGKKDEFYLHLLFEKQDSLKRENGEIIGIDRGINNLVVTSDGQFFSGKKIKKNQRKYLFLRKKLQAKGTHSAKKLLKKISGKEKRFSRDLNHCISKKLSSDLIVKTYVLEDLKGIRTIKRGKKLNKFLSSWPFFQLELFLKYKCNFNGITIEKTSAKYTSQKCSACGHTYKGNRKRDKFCCVNCNFKEHADLNAAINIKNNYLRSKRSKQVAVNQPSAKPEMVFTSS